MNIGEAWSALWAKAEDAVPQIKASSWTSSSMGTLLVVVGLMVAAYLGHELLSDANMNRLTILAAVYMLTNMVPKAIETYWNGKLHHSDWIAPEPTVTVSTVIPPSVPKSP